MNLAGSELILNKDGSIYHLNLHPEDIAETMLLVGDPGRVKQVSKYFDAVRVKKSHREFITHTGRLGKREFSVISTGIGTDNIDIVLNELDALANFDLIKKTPRDKPKSLKFIRLGTSGALHAEILPGEIVVSAAAIGLDNLMYFYDSPTTPAEKKAVSDLKKVLPEDLKFYFFEASELLLKSVGAPFKKGITVTSPGFYGPQGRQLRASAKYQDLLPKLGALAVNGQAITNFEMETAGIYGLAKTMGHHALSVNAILANRVRGTFSKNPKKAVEGMIGKVFETLTAG